MEGVKQADERTRELAALLFVVPMERRGGMLRENKPLASRVRAAVDGTEPLGAVPADAVQRAADSGEGLEDLALRASAGEALMCAVLHGRIDLVRRGCLCRMMARRRIPADDVVQAVAAASNGIFRAALEAARMHHAGELRRYFESSPECCGGAHSLSASELGRLPQPDRARGPAREPRETPAERCRRRAALFARAARSPQALEHLFRVIVPLLAAGSARGVVEEAALGCFLPHFFSPRLHVLPRASLLSCLAREAIAGGYSGDPRAMLFEPALFGRFVREFAGCAERLARGFPRQLAEEMQAEGGWVYECLDVVREYAQCEGAAPEEVFFGGDGAGAFLARALCLHVLPRAPRSGREVPPAERQACRGAARAVLSAAQEKAPPAARAAGNDPCVKRAKRKAAEAGREPTVHLPQPGGAFPQSRGERARPSAGAGLRVAETGIVDGPENERDRMAAAGCLVHALQEMGVAPFGPRFGEAFAAEVASVGFGAWERLAAPVVALAAAAGGVGLSSGRWRTVLEGFWTRSYLDAAERSELVRAAVARLSSDGVLVPDDADCCLMLAL